MTTTPSAADRVDRTPFVAIAALASLAGAVAIWLPFAWSTSPADAVTDGDLWYLAVPFLLAVPIAGAWAWVSARGSLPAAAQWAWRAMAGCAMAVTALFYARVVGEDNWPGSTTTEWIAFGAPLVLAAGWAALMLRWMPGRRASGAPEAIALMEAAFLPNAVLCLLSFVDQRQIGWYVSLAVSAAFAAHVVATARRAGPGAQAS